MCRWLPFSSYVSAIENLEDPLFSCTTMKSNFLQIVEQKNQQQQQQPTQEGLLCVYCCRRMKRLRENPPPLVIPPEAEARFRQVVGRIKETGSLDAHRDRLRIPYVVSQARLAYGATIDEIVEKFNIQSEDELYIFLCICGQDDDDDLTRLF